jgi:hypothetical protein
MNIKETVVIEFDGKDTDALSQASAVLTRLYDEMGDRGKDFIAGNDDFGYTRADITHAEEILSFLISEEQFTID